MLQSSLGVTSLEARLCSSQRLLKARHDCRGRLRGATGVRIAGAALLLLQHLRHVHRGRMTLHARSESAEPSLGKLPSLTDRAGPA